MSSQITKKQESPNEVSREGTRGGAFYRPNVDIIDKPDELVLKADMPGVGADGVSLNYEMGTLTLHGTVKARQPEKQMYLMREYGIADFHREFNINEEIAPEGIHAEYKNGVLVVRMPKAEAAKPRSIEVKAH